ncbi:DUF4271 domain-containing protein [Mucilaginibacter sp. RS28]|uniref:DUF4271 domain-containing protein n=1 Tax=Mucilaginibacter straminoryzae TaxID=2932774 RepID=A0A9X1X3Q7_9SPHI|nr:DUF4271 domain-containing protein [Mucilaginibacter straminoryzae]MCJ8210398.1 DUF4271 domain-containing protein [Mucilaginibacter straminoryzae]
MRVFCWTFLLIVLGLKGFAQDSALTPPPDTVYHRPVIRSAAQLLLDSVARAEQLRMKRLGDSVAMQYFNKPDSLRPDKFYELMLQTQTYKDYGFLSMPESKRSKKSAGHYRPTRDPWIIIIIFGLVIYSALLNRAASKDILNVMMSFYSKRILSQVSKEDSLLASWSFVGLFLLFGLTFGLFLYQVTSYYEIFYSISGAQLFISLSVLIIIVFAVKLLLLRFIGFIFDVGKIVSEYITVLYLTYFNIAFVFLPVTVCFSLLAAQYIPYLLFTALGLVVVIFIWQYLRSSLNIISNFRFPKFYLIIYLCALEICPILILIKALNIRT